MTIQSLGTILEAGEFSGNSKSELLNFEENAKLQFPIAYRDFLLSSNGGWCPSQELVHSSERSVIEFFGFRDSRTSLTSIFETYHIHEKRLPSELICIAHDPCGDPICLQVGGEGKGSVWIIDHEDEDDLMELAKEGAWQSGGCSTRLADSFEAFVDEIHLGDRR